MSADNWTLCPKCQRGMDPFTAEDFYLREGYELGIVEGKFYVIYDGECQECNYVFEYRHNEEIDA